MAGAFSMNSFRARNRCSRWLAGQWHHVKSIIIDTAKAFLAPLCSQDSSHATGTERGPASASARCLAASPGSAPSARAGPAVPVPSGLHRFSCCTAAAGHRGEELVSAAAPVEKPVQCAQELKGLSYFQSPPSQGGFKRGGWQRWETGIQQLQHWEGERLLLCQGLVGVSPRI